MLKYFYIKSVYVNKATEVKEKGLTRKAFVPHPGFKYNFPRFSIKNEHQRQSCDI